VGADLVFVMGIVAVWLGGGTGVVMSQEIEGEWCSEWKERGDENGKSEIKAEINTSREVCLPDPLHHGSDAVLIERKSDVRGGPYRHCGVPLAEEKGDLVYFICALMTCRFYIIFCIEIMI